MAWETIFMLLIHLWCFWTGVIMLDHSSPVGSKRPFTQVVCYCGFLYTRPYLLADSSHLLIRIFWFIQKPKFTFFSPNFVYLGLWLPLCGEPRLVTSACGKHLPIFRGKVLYMLRHKPPSYNISTVCKFVIALTITFIFQFQLLTQWRRSLTSPLSSSTRPWKPIWSVNIWFVSLC